MVVGAFTGWLAVYQGATLWAGVGIAALAGAALGLLHAVLTVPLGLSQHVSGLGVTLFGTSLASYAYRVTLPQVTTPPTIEPFAPMSWLGVPLLSSADAADAAGARQRARARLCPQSHAGRPGRAHGGRESRCGRRPGHRRHRGADVDRRRGIGADGGRRRLPYAVGVQRVFLQHGQRPRMDLRGARRLRVVASGQGARAARCSSRHSTRCNCACSRRAARSSPTRST